MQISLKWVNELINIENVNFTNLIEKLTLGGFEVEEVLEIKINNKKTIALDISATANRSDSLSVKGISLELAVLLNIPAKILSYSAPNFRWEKNIKKLPTKNIKNVNCSRFIALTVNHINTKIVPTWLQQKLRSAGLTPENSLRDFQNYLILETGYPFEFYDLEKIQSKLNRSDFDLTLVSNKNHTVFKANNSTNYELTDSIMLVKANELVLSIGGIISSDEVKISETTTSILIEASIFNSAKIRQCSRTISLRTDRSSRYEKSIKDTNLFEACYRLISLLRISNANLDCKLHTNSKSLVLNLTPISLHYQNIQKILGPIIDEKKENDAYIDINVISNYLDRLQFDYVYDNINFIWSVNVSHHRSEDIIQEIDLIEEIGRLHGFNNFLTRLPKNNRIGFEDFSYQTRKKFTSCLINLGLNELIHYSLVSNDTFIKNEVKLVNPLINEYSSLRFSLLPNLIKTVQENLKHGTTTIEGFEYGHVFSYSKLQSVNEQEVVAGVFGNFKTKVLWTESSSFVSWFEAKNKIEQLFKKLNFSVYWKPYQLSLTKNIFHPHCTAEICLTNGTNLGVFGRIHPFLAKKLNFSPNIYLFEFNFTLIRNRLKMNRLIIYHEYKSYPKVIKDLSFIIERKISFHRLQEVLYMNGSHFLTQVNLLDKYQGKSIPDDYTSFCLQLVFQSSDKTLKTNEIDKILTNFEDILENRFKAIVRK